MSHPAALRSGVRTRRSGALGCICDYSELQLHLKSRVGKHWSYNAPAKLPTGLLNSCGLCYEEEIFLMHGLAVLNSSWCSGEEQPVPSLSVPPPPGVVH